MCVSAFLVFGMDPFIQHDSCYLFLTEYGLSSVSMDFAQISFLIGRLC